MPIDTKSLRLGNIVLYEKEMHVVKNIFHGGIMLELYWGVPVIEDVEPVILTTDILEKCGLELDNTYSDNDYSVYFNKSGYFFLQTDWRNKEGFCPMILPFGGELESFTVNLKHLHQLQNLYYSLTGEELNIEL